MQIYIFLCGNSCPLVDVCVEFKLDHRDSRHSHNFYRGEGKNSATPPPPKLSSPPTLPRKIRNKTEKDQKGKTESKPSFRLATKEHRYKYKIWRDWRKASYYLWTCQMYYLFFQLPSSFIVTENFCRGRGGREVRPYVGYVGWLLNSLLWERV